MTGLLYWRTVYNLHMIISMKCHARSFIGYILSFFFVVIVGKYSIFDATLASIQGIDFLHGMMGFSMGHPWRFNSDFGKLWIFAKEV